jgi:hypothetical protein
MALKMETLNLCSESNSQLRNSARIEGKFSIFFVDDDSDSSLRELLIHLGGNVGNTHFSLALDLQGINLGATGEICIIQLILSHSPTQVYLLDVCALGSKAFTAEIRSNDQVP